MIEINQLTKQYGSGKHAVHALKGVTLTIEHGMFGLLGPNGAGKTTLMRILAGIVHANSGSVSVNGHSLHHEAGRTAVKHTLGYLPQELGFYPELSAYQFVDYLAILKGVHDTRQRRTQVERALEQVALAEHAHRKIKEFSGGMKRRVGIAQAIVNNPRVLVVDEPTAGLDPEERIRFRNLLVEMARSRVVLLSTHIVADIGQTCEQLALLQRGQIRFLGSPAELIRRAQGHVWEITATNGETFEGFTVVSMLQRAEGVQYRIVGAEFNASGAQLAEPSLEDGYVWQMNSAAS